MKTYLIFNPLARNSNGLKMKEEALDYLKDKKQNINVLNALELDAKELINTLQEDDELILVGGDGTLNHFVNYVYGLDLKNKMYLYKAGTGNDFLNDISDDKECKLVLLNDYLKKLPKVTINGKTRYYINGIGYGIDGQVCEIADALKAKGKKKINYTSIAIKLLLFKFKRPDAKVFVDGKELNYKKVWLASAMNGKFYGGGMMIAPKQDRKSGFITFAVMHKANKLRTLLLFPKIFKGGQIEYPQYFTCIKCKKIEVHFTIPTALQIDGETVSNVTSYIAEID